MAWLSAESADVLWAWSRWAPGGSWPGGLDPGDLGPKGPRRYVRTQDFEKALIQESSLNDIGLLMMM